MRQESFSEASMRRWQLILAVVGVWLLSTGAYFIHQSSLPKMDVLLAAGDCRTPTTILEPPPGVQPIGAVIMVHGLAANRRTMEYLGTDFAGHGFRAYLIDLPGHGDSKQAFSFIRAEKCAEAVVSSLVTAGQIDPRKTVLLGHSMGGAIVIRIADRDPVAATIAIAPAPMTPPTRMPANLLIFSGQYDFGVLKRQAQALAAAAG
jgi:alpha-beta hydrolase superfamily lysophospholipase